MDDGLGLGAAGDDPLDDAGDMVAGPVEIPRIVAGLVGRRVRAVAVADAATDEMAAEAAGWPGRAAAEDDRIARPAPPREPGAGLAGLAATLIIAGSWAHQAPFRRVRGRRAGTRRSSQRGHVRRPRASIGGSSLTRIGSRGVRLKA